MQNLTKNSVVREAPPVYSSDENSVSSQNSNVQTPNNWSSSLQTLLDRPPATLSRILIVGSTIFCFAFGAWSWFGQVEEVGQARGRLIPKGKTYKVEAIEVGKILKTRVEEGEPVVAGQVLAEIDSELVRQDIERLEQKLAAYQRQLEQTQTLLEQAILEAEAHRAISSAEIAAQRSSLAAAEEKVALTRQLLLQVEREIAAYRARQIRLDSISALNQERLAQLNTEAAAHQQRIARLAPFVESGAISQEFLFQAEQELGNTQQQIVQKKLEGVSNIDEQLFQAEQSLRELEFRKTQNSGELRSSLKEVERLQAELTQKQVREQQIHLESQQKIKRLKVEMLELEAQISEVQNQLISTSTKLERQFLKSPIDGVILSYNLQNTGQVVSPGETIAEIAPQQTSLILSSTLPNREAGFVEVGMSAQVKIDAYPYQDYGTIAGEVISISPDSERLGANEETADTYTVEIALLRDYVTEEGEKFQFKPGQTATAEIIIRRRRIAEILLDPIRKLGQDGINL